MALPRGQRGQMKISLGHQIKRGSLRMSEHSVTAIGLGEQGIVGTSMAMSFQRGRGEPWRGVSRMKTPSMRGLEEQRKRGASRMTSNSVSGLGEPSIAAGSRIRSPSLGGGMIGNSGMPLPSVRGLGEHSHRMSEGERMRSAGRGLGYSKMTDDNQIILPLGRGRGDPRMRDFGRMISPTIRGGGDPRMRGFGRMISPTLRGGGGFRMKTAMGIPIRGRGGTRMRGISGVRNRATSFREANSNAHINQMERRHNIYGGGSGMQIPEGIDHGNEVSSTIQEIIEVIDISEDDSTLYFGSNASLEEAGSTGSILHNSPTVRDSSPVLNKLKNRDVSVSVSLKKELELPPGFKLPPDITVTHLPSSPSSNQKIMLTPERIVKILSGNDSLPKKKVELELSDPQIEIMMELGLM